MIIIDPRKGIEREVREVKRVIHIMPDENGIDKDMECVEFTIIGKNSEWGDWVSYDDFKESNPTINLN